TIVSIDETGRPRPHHIHLHHDESYRLLIQLFYKGHSINDEIIEEGDEHQFFFIPSAEGIIEYKYNDADKDGRGIGLDGEIAITGEGEIDLKIVLRHGLNKAHAAAQAWNSPNYQQAGGADDL